jgi:hypothetical protein
MKAIMVLGGMLLALCAASDLWRARRRAVRYCPVQPVQPLPPSTYTYKEVTYSLN